MNKIGDGHRLFAGYSWLSLLMRIVVSSFLLHLSTYTILQTQR